MSAHRLLLTRMHDDYRCDACRDERDQRDADDHTEAEDAARAGEAAGGTE